MSTTTSEALSLDALLEGHGPWLTAFLRLRSGPLIRAQESCSDLAQSVCREVLACADQLEFRSEVAFRSWLATVAERKVIERHRYYTRAKRDAARTVATQDIDRLAATYSRFATPSADAAAHEQVLRLEAIFDELTDDYREIILLFHVVGMSHREISERMGRTEEATRSLLRRALARLAILMRAREGRA